MENTEFGPGITCLVCLYKHGHVIWEFDNSDNGRLAAIEHLKQSHGLVGVSL